ncbi:SHOCT domain-containing protein [Spirillospora sp. NPDC047279]|uniref:SHOCT domain-containing protein n=1 Tax=Spirillospora sp. NPDC047279 TaxID=3155478 RepID=UPI0033EA483B
MDDYPLLNLFWTMMWFFLWVLWLMLLFRVFADIFRDDSLSGWVKAGWSIFVVVLPFLGVFVYLIVRGGQMGSREHEWFRRRVGETGPARGAGQADELTRLAELKNKGDLTSEEYERAKAKVLAA